MSPARRSVREIHDEGGADEQPQRRGPFLPGDTDAERAVIAALMTTPAAYDDVVETLVPEDFVDPACAAVYRAVMAVEAAGRPIDVITVADELRRNRDLKRVGDRAGLEALATSTGADLANVAAHVEIIADKSRLRRVLSAGQEMCQAAIAPEAQGARVADFAESLVFAIGEKRGVSTMIPMARAVPALLSELAQTRSSLLLGHSTGLDDLDRMTGGFQGGQLIVLAARPGVGKSALALQMARHIAEVTGLVVPFMSYEMSTSELTVRMLASALQFDVSRLRAGDLPDGMERDLAVAAERMAGLPLYIDDNPPSTIAGVRAAMRRLARRGQVGAIFVDYLQLMESDRRGRDTNRNDEVSDISRGLKRLAAELSVPIVALSQLNRNVEMRTGSKRPMLSDLRDSGAVEQDANTVMFLYRESLYNSAADPTLAEIIVAKQRSGPVGTVFAEWNPSATSFANTARRPMGGGGGGSAF